MPNHWLDTLDKLDQDALHMLCGALGIPAPNEYESLAALLHTVRMRHSEAASLIKQAAKVLNAQ